MSWQCGTCKADHTDLPTCFGIEAPWRALVPEQEFQQRVELTKDQCVVDEREFFVRGHIVIPIHDHPIPLEFSVWSSLSEASFVDMCDRWEDPDRAQTPPYFGWLCSPIHVYPETIHLKLSVQTKALGCVPHFTVESSEHPLFRDQHEGISIARWHELVHQLMPTQPTTSTGASGRALRNILP